MIRIAQQDVQRPALSDHAKLIALFGADQFVQFQPRFGHGELFSQPLSQLNVLIPLSIIVLYHILRGFLHIFRRFEFSLDSLLGLKDNGFIVGPRSLVNVLLQLLLVDITGAGC